MQTSESVKEIAAALLDYHAEASNLEGNRRTTIEGKSKDGKPYSFSYPYSDLAGITDGTRQLLAKHGLCVTQELVVEGDRIGSRTRLLHRSGEWIEYEPVWLPAGGPPKDWGSAATYSRRFSLSAVLYLATPGDDDERSATRGATRGRNAKATARQIAKIKAEAERAHVSDQTLRGDLRETYELDVAESATFDEALAKLSVPAASHLIERLMKEADKRAAAVAAGADPVTGELASDDEAPGMDAAAARDSWSDDPGRDEIPEGQIC